MKNKEILEITNIKINLPNKTIELTSEEARLVVCELNKLFALEQKKETLQEALNDLAKQLKRQEQSPTYVPYPIYVEKWHGVPYYPWKIGEPVWAVDPAYQPTYTSPTTQPLNPSYTTCLSIDLTENK